MTKGAVPPIPIVPRDDATPGPVGVEIDPEKHDFTVKHRGEVGVTVVAGRTFLSFATKNDAKHYGGGGSNGNA